MAGTDAGRLDITMRKPLEGVTMTVHVHLTRGCHFRWTVGRLLLRAAGWVLGCAVREERTQAFPFTEGMQRLIDRCRRMGAHAGEVTAERRRRWLEELERDGG